MRPLDWDESWLNLRRNELNNLPIPLCRTLFTPKVLSHLTGMRFLATSMAKQYNREALLVSGGPLWLLDAQDGFKVVALKVLCQYIVHRSLLEQDILEIMDIDRVAKLIYDSLHASHRNITETVDALKSAFEVMRSLNSHGLMTPECTLTFLKHGVIEIALQNLEANKPVIRDNFHLVWTEALNQARKSWQGEAYPGVLSQASRVIDQISSHPEFTLETICSSGIELARPQEGVSMCSLIPILLANVMDNNQDEIHAKWPWVLEETLLLIKKGWPPSFEEDPAEFIQSAQYLSCLTKDHKKYVDMIVTHPSYGYWLWERTYSSLGETNNLVGVEIAGNILKYRYDGAALEALLKFPWYFAHINEAPSGRFRTMANALVDARHTIDQAPRWQLIAAALLLRDTEETIMSNLAQSYGPEPRLSTTMTKHIKLEFEALKRIKLGYSAYVALGADYCTLDFPLSMYAEDSLELVKDLYGS